MEATKKFEALPLHNLGLYRLQDAVGRASELDRLSTWFQQHPVIAITGPSGAGKSTLGTMLAVQNAHRFEDGILWISATGRDPFRFYDIVRTIEDVLATGITGQTVTAWPLYVLQQIYGANRLIILDELTEADADTVDKILAMIGQIQPGGAGRFVLIGRSLPQRLLDVAGEAHLILDGLDQAAVQAWVAHYQEIYTLDLQHSDLLYHLTGGHPLALKLVAGLWHSDDRGQLFDLLSVQTPGDWEALLKATVVAALSVLDKEQPATSQLLTSCSQASGGFDAETIRNLYWANIISPSSLLVTVQELLKRGLILYNSEANRYFIHPLIRRYLSVTNYAHLTGEEQTRAAYAHAEYYLHVARHHAKAAPPQWHLMEEEWGNLRTALNFLVAEFKKQRQESDQEANRRSNPDEPYELGGNLHRAPLLLRDYVLTLRNYLVSRHPPEGLTWFSTSIAAGRYLAEEGQTAQTTPSHTEALLSKHLAAIAHSEQDYENALVWYRHSLTYFQVAQDNLQCVAIMLALGTTLQALKRSDQALNTYRKAMSLATAHALEAQEAAIQAQIGEVYYQQGDYEAALNCYQRALALSEKLQDQATQATYHNRIGRALEAQEIFEPAIDHYHQAATIYEALNDPLGLSTAYDNLGAAYFHAGRPEEALDWYERDLAIIDRLGNWFDLAATLHNMGHVALDIQNDQAALNYFTRSRDIYQQFGQIELAEEEQTLIDTITDQHPT